jgi:hypothetical protein
MVQATPEMDVFLTGNGGFDDGRVRRHAGQNQIKPFFFVNDGEAK